MTYELQPITTTKQSLKMLLVKGVDLIFEYSGIRTRPDLARYAIYMQSTHHNSQDNNQWRSGGPLEKYFRHLIFVLPASLEKCSTFFKRCRQPTAHLNCYVVPRL